MVGTEESMPDVMYQVDSRNTATGKIVASSKQRACWRYGHMKNDPHPIGASCRGREHEVTVIWSITSGKRLVYHDSKEVHFSVVPMGRRGNSKFQCSWSSRDHIFKVRSCGGNARTTSLACPPHGHVLSVQVAAEKASVCSAVGT